MVKNATNDEIQNIINGTDENTVIKLTAENYNGISIIINKPITLNTNNSIIKGEKIRML